MRKTRNFLGTPFEDSKETTLTGRGLLPWEQKVADEKTGKRKFHGAFTGGFEAGYKNTCGSETGFTPMQFTSSRRSRQQVTQDVKQFMDDEDEMEIVIGGNLRPKEEFQAIGEAGKGEGIGTKLYRLITQGEKAVKKQVFGPTMPPQAYSIDMPSIKSDLCGLGYASGGVIRTEVLKPTSNKRIRSLFTEEIEYESEEMQGPILRPAEIAKGIEPSGAVLAGFRLAKPLQPSATAYPPPSLPKDYNPRPFLLSFQPHPSFSPRLLDPNQRQNLLEEPRKPALCQHVLNSSDLERISKLKSFVRSSERLINPTAKDLVTLPFSEDPRKRDRLYRFICTKEGKELGGIAPMGVSPTQLMTASQLDKEEAEFAVIYSQMKGETAAAAPTKLPDIVNKRSVQPWQPCEVLCVRFNVPEPVVGTVELRREEVFVQEVLPVVRSTGLKQVERVERPLLLSDPSFQDLFKSIFEPDLETPSETPLDLAIGSKRTR